MTEKLLEINDLHTHFFVDGKRIPAVDGVSLHINRGEVLGLVGESGCGKSVTSLSIMRLIPDPPGKIVAGSIIFKGEDLTKASEKRMRSLRGNEIAMIFQEPMTSLNPVYTIGEQIAEVVRLHLKYDKKRTRSHVIEMLQKVGIPRAAEIVDEYPHQLSGGMRQRVMIAMAMSCQPQLLIADEPTTALDVTIQAQILDLMRELNRETGAAIMLITHDLGVVAEMCDRVVVMYAGKVVEEGDVRTIFRNPKHPYTEGLLKSIPDWKGQKRRLYSIPGNVPIPGSMPQGCLFAPRCEHVMDKCWQESPPLFTLQDNGESAHKTRCWLHEESASLIAEEN